MVAPAAAASLAFMTIAAGAVGCVVAGSIADRIGRPLVTIVAMAVSGACALAIGPSIDVSAVASALGGGGHVRAAGFTHHGPVPAPAIDALLTVLGR